MADTRGPAVLMWFRLDLRLRDNPALAAATATGAAVVPVFVDSPEEMSACTPGAASRWWLHQSLLRLDESLGARGSRLIVRKGEAAEALAALAAETGAPRIFCNRVYVPAALAHEAKVKKQLAARGIELIGSNGSLLFEPGSLRTGTGDSFRVFTPFWRALWKQRDEIHVPRKAPKELHAPKKWPHSLEIRDLALEPKIDWASGLRVTWSPGEDAALARLRSFARRSTADYAHERDRPDHDGTSRLSPHLHFGEVSPQQVWAAAAGRPGAESFLRQLAWREFAFHLLCAHPHTPRQPFHQEFRRFPWRRNERRLKAWQQGRTGYPYIDAAMRQLWTTGWMHNRARMAVASFLVKDLLIPWQDGAAWFLDTLVDADFANNTLGWQWVAGCGADAAPYFRVFHPVLQGRKFDPAGDYVREWAPALRKLAAKHIHEPWTAPAEALAAAGVRLGETWPRPIVDHAEARDAALAAFRTMKAHSRGK
jgi:deoxyribodipyrimidine photo-lyase